MITQTYNIDLVPNGKPYQLIVNVSQYDKLSRTLEFNVYSSGVLFEIPSGTAAVIQGTKRDGTGFSYNMTVSGSKVSMDIEQQMTVFDGDVHCEILLTKNAERLGSANFILRVEKAAISDETIISETDIPIFRSFASGGSNGQVFVHGEGNEGNWETIETGGFDPLKVYPVGSIYISVNSTNPSELFGGTWQSIGSGRVLQGADDTHAAGETIEAGIPNIKGNFPLAYGGSLSDTAEIANGFCVANVTMTEVPGGFPLDASVFSPVYGRSDTVQPPAFVVNIWQRTA